ncbi:MAG: metal ABC transporter ATP-binding protein [Candidatus Kariarchaeaceae archaeon]|jgi:ABC-type Mn2+/Zn2+ transport system ATPase subunit
MEFDENTPIVSLSNVYVSYQNTEALCNYNLDIYPGELIGICGPNGSGKTTLLKAILGLLPLDQGEIKLYGHPARERKDLLRYIGYVPQIKAIDQNFPALVKDIVMMGRYAHLGLVKRPTASDWDIVDLVMEEVDIHELADRNIGALSGGQFQKVLLAKALAQEPRVLLLDEPTSALDFRMTTSLMHLLQRLNTEVNLTIISVHHDLQLLKEHMTRIVCMDRTVEWSGKPDDADLDETLLRLFFYNSAH